MLQLVYLVGAKMPSLPWRPLTRPPGIPKPLGVAATVLVRRFMLVVPLSLHSKQRERGESYRRDLYTSNTCRHRKTHTNYLNHTN